MLHQCDKKSGYRLRLCKCKTLHSDGKAIETGPDTCAPHAARLNNLGIRLRDRFLRTQDLGDLEESINFIRQAISGTAADHPDWARWFNNLSVPLGYRYLVTKEMTDLQEAIEAI